MATARTTAAAEQPGPIMGAYVVMSPLNHDQLDYAIGDEIWLTADQAAPLLGGAVALPAQAPAAVSTEQ